MTRGIILVVALVWGVGCKTLDPVIATGELLHTTGQEFVAVGGAMNKGYAEDKTISVEQYHQWAQFAKEFKVAYALAIMTWEVAAANPDSDDARKVRDIILDLGIKLAKFTPLVVNLLQDAQ